MAKNDGGPAAPCAGVSDEGMAAFSVGLTIRDYFAAKSDMPWSVCVELLEHQGIPITLDSVARNRAAYRYVEADAMLAERERRQDADVAAAMKELDTDT